MNRLILTFLITILCCCDRNSDIGHSLDTADSLLDSYPDSALNIIRNIDRSILNSKEEKARYGLLLTMALLKTNEDEADLKDLKDAIKFYGSSTKPSRETMLTHYALAATSDSTVQKLQEYDKAIELAANPNKDAYIAKAFLNKANIYHKAFSTPDERECIEKGKEHAFASNDTSLIIHTFLISGNYQTGIGEYGKAINEYHSALDLVNKSKFTDEKGYILKSMAYASSLGGKHKEATAVYDSLMQNYSSYLNTNDICTYAGSLAYLKDFRRADEVLRLLTKEDIGENMADWLYTNAIIQYMKSNYKEAFEYLNSTIPYYNKVSTEKLDGNLSRQEKLISQIEAQNQKKLAESRKTTVWLITACSVAVVAFLAMLIYNLISRHKRHLEEERLKREQIRKDSERETGMLMSRLEDLDSANTALSASLDSLSAEYTQSLIGLRNSSLINFRLLHKGISSFCNNIPVGITTQTAIKVYDKERMIRLLPYKDSKMVAELRNQINRLSDNLIDRIETEARLSDSDIKTLIYEICGFNYRSIAELLETTPAAVAARRTRLKAKLSDINPVLLNELNRLLGAIS